MPKRTLAIALTAGVEVATKASAKTVAIRCGQTCTVPQAATGPAATHAEGPIAFLNPR